MQRMLRYAHPRCDEIFESIFGEASIGGMPIHLILEYIGPFGLAALLALLFAIIFTKMSKKRKTGIAGIVASVIAIMGFLAWRVIWISNRQSNRVIGWNYYGWVYTLGTVITLVAVITCILFIRICARNRAETTQPKETEVEKMRRELEQMRSEMERMKQGGIREPEARTADPEETAPEAQIVEAPTREEAFTAVKREEVIRPVFDDTANLNASSVAQALHPDDKDRSRPLCLLLLAAALGLVLFKLIPYIPHIGENWSLAFGQHWDFRRFAFHTYASIRYLLMLISIGIAAIGVFKWVRSKGALIASCATCVSAVVLEIAVHLMILRIPLQSYYPVFLLWILSPAVLVIASGIIYYKHSPEEKTEALPIEEHTHFEIRECQDDMKEYKVITLKDKFWSFKYRFEEVEAMLNDYARQGWTVSTALTGRQNRLLGLVVGARNQLMIILEREKQN